MLKRPWCLECFVVKSIECAAVDRHASRLELVYSMDTLLGGGDLQLN